MYYDAIFFFGPDHYYETRFDLTSLNSRFFVVFNIKHSFSVTICYFKLGLRLQNVSFVRFNFNVKNLFGLGKLNAIVGIIFSRLVYIDLTIFFSFENDHTFDKYRDSRMVRNQL